MPNFGKPDNSGRSSGKRNGRLGAKMRPPNGVPWTWLTKELLYSDAWRLQSLRCRQFIDALLIDHMANAGQENGRLMATYDQLNNRGLARSSVSKAIAEAKHLGLVRCMKKGGRYGGANKPSEYRLTFFVMQTNSVLVYDATNEWKSVTQESVKLWKDHEKLKRKVNKEYKAKQITGPNGRPSPDRTVGLAKANLEVVKKQN